VGRPAGDITSKIPEIDFPGDARIVLDDLQSKEKEVRLEDGRYYLVTMRPYRTIENKIDGVVITLLDVTKIKTSEQAAQSAREYADSIVNTVREPLIILNGDLRVVSANRAFYLTFETPVEETENKLIYELGNGQWDIPRLRELLEEIIPKEHSFENFEVDHEFPGIGRRIVVLNARLIGRGEGKANLILLAMEDITEKKNEAELPGGE
jgi:two-component system CheB/CheR fusion protein